MAQATLIPAVNLHAPTAIGDVTPNTGAFTVLTGTSLALGGATLGGNALAVTGSSLLGATTITSASDLNLKLNVVTGQQYTSLYLQNNAVTKAQFYWDNGGVNLHFGTNVSNAPILLEVNNLASTWITTSGINLGTNVLGFSSALSVTNDTGLSRISANVTGFGNGTQGDVSGTVRAASYQLSTDVILARDAANTLAQRNGTNAQIFNIYETYTNASNFGDLTLGFYTDHYTIATNQAGTGAARPLYIGTIGSAGISFLINGGLSWQITSSGNFVNNADNTYDIGASGATRPRDFFLGRNATVGGFGRFGSPVRVPSYTVATLPAGATGDLAFVTDATLTAITGLGLAPTGGGANIVPVYNANGTWLMF